MDLDLDVGREIPSVDKVGNIGLALVKLVCSWDTGANGV